MGEIGIFGLIFLAALFRSQREKVNVPAKYNDSRYVTFPFQNWFNPELSWVNKKSKYAIWQYLKSTVLVMFTDYKHALGFLQINCYFFIVWKIGSFPIETYIFFWLAHGVSFESFYAKWSNKKFKAKK